MNTVDLLGDDKVIADIINNELAGEFVDDYITSVGQRLMQDCTQLTKATFPNATAIGSYAFANTGLVEITADDFPVATGLGAHTFEDCTRLRKATFPAVTSHWSNTSGTERPALFNGCSSLTEIYFPNLTTLGWGNIGHVFGTAPALKDILPSTFPVLTSVGGNYHFNSLIALERFISFSITSFVDYRSFGECRETFRVLRVPNATTSNEILSIVRNSGWPQIRLIDVKDVGGGIPGGALYSAPNLTTLILRKTTAIVNLESATGRFVTATKLKNGGEGMDIYVPQALLEEYKTATNWSTVYGYGTARFHAIEGSDYENPEYSFDVGMEED